MKIFILNCGSTTFKYQLIDMTTKDVLAIGLVERIGMPNVALSYEGKGEKIKEELGAVTHKEGIERVLELLTSANSGVIKSLDEIHSVGHRVVHGGDKFTTSAVITDEILKDIEACVPLAPLHNPANIVGIKAIQTVMPKVKNVAVFDTAYHQTMPAESYRYAIPSEFYTQYKIRKYGFHGTSHQYVSQETAKMLGIDYNKFNAVTCHLGGGCSLAAIKDGKSYDTSMGLTPLEGLVMASRSGDIDPAIPYFMTKNCGMTIEDVDNTLNKKSGLLGLSGLSMDLRDIESAAAEGNKDSQLAIDAFIHRVVHYIGGYAALLGRVDAIIFTAGIGENGKEMRKWISDRLSIFGVKISDERNNVRGKATIISDDSSAIKLVLMPTNEELMIAHDTQKLTS